MSSRYGILCVLLFFIVLMLGYENYEIWSSPSAVSSEGDTGKKGESKPDPLPAAAGPRAAVPRSAFNLIAEKNVFSPDRKEFSSAGPAAAIAKPATRPQVTLYGVAITENFEIASITNPGRALHKGERDTKTLKVGDMVGEYKLTKILPDRIVMEAGEDSFEVYLYDPRTPKRRAELKTPVRPATITSATTTPPGVPQPVPPAVPVPSGVSPTLPTPQPVPPSPIPRASGMVPQGGYQPSGTPPTPGIPAAVPDPGLWRGRRPVVPGVSPGSGGK